MDKKTRPINIYSLQEDLLKLKDTHILKVKGWKTYFMQMKRERKAEVAVLLSEKIAFKTKAIVRNKEEHYIMIKGTI